MNYQKMSKIEEFERVVVFRSARFLPLLLSVVATLILAVAAVALFYSIVPSWKPRPPAPVPEPSQVSVSGSEIDDYISRSEQPAPQAAKPNQQSQPGNAAQNSNAPVEPVVSPDAKSIADEMDAIRKQSLALKLPWINEYQTICQQVFFGGCYNQRTVMTSRGVSGYIEQAFGHHNEGNVAIETIRVGDQTYRINPSHYSEKMAILKELEGVLTSAQTENARKLLAAWGKIREEKERDRERALRHEQEQRAEEYINEQIKYERTVERKHRIRRVSLGAAAMALGGFVLLGLILAVLAVERHTRLLEAQLAASTASTGNQVSHPTPVPVEQPPSPEQRRCRSCGQPVDAKATFCEECGSPIV